MTTALVDIDLTVNGDRVAAPVPAALRLADFLRDDLGLTGTHVACGEGPCGSCTVLLDGLPVRSCLMLTVQANGGAVETVESVGVADGPLHPVQAALHQHHGLQCGFCTPGLVMSAVALFRADPHPSDADIETMLQGHLCRCTGYRNILSALKSLSGRPSFPAGL